MENFIKKLDSLINHWPDRVYTFKKILETGIHFREVLSYTEQLCFLDFRSALNGDNLTVYDIGAAWGLVSSCSAKLNNVRNVHAFEPIPGAFAELTEHTRRYPHVKRHNVALGAENGEMDIWITAGARNASSLLKMQSLHKEEFHINSFDNHPQKVQVVRLDDFVSENHLPLPDVVKIDVQGYEDRVLKGGAKTIVHAAYVILEMSFASLYEGSPLFDGIYQQMRDLNFELAGIGGKLYGASGRQLQVDGIFQNTKGS